MLTGLVVDNFKAFGSRQHVALKPLTLIFGGNSAGKSSLIQALLLMRQSLISNDYMPSRLRGPELVVRGALVDLGSFDALIHGHDRSRTLSLGVEFTPRRRFQGEARLFPDVTSTLEWQYSQGASQTEIEHVSSVIGFEGESILLPPQPSPGPIRASGVRRRGNVAVLSPEDTQTLFRWVGRRVDSSDVDLEVGFGDCAVLGMIAGAPTSMFGMVSEGVLNPRVDDADDDFALERAESIGSPEQNARNEAVTEWLRAAFGTHRIALAEVSYLGPFRSPPERLNVLTGERVTGVGTAGENVVDLLARSKPLLNDVNTWLARLEIPYEVDVRAVSDAAVAGAIGEVHCMLLKDARTGVEVSPTDVGFGIGQVLPVVVQSIIGRTDVLCIEQPEIHLHPGLQSRLAEMFGDLVRTQQGAQFILETHSEHMILRLQSMIRQQRLSASEVGVIHVGHNSLGESVVREIRLSERGEFMDEWPSGFFDERFDDVFGIS